MCILYLIRQDLHSTSKICALLTAASDRWFSWFCVPSVLLLAGMCLLSLTYSVLSQAYAILPHVLRLVPPEGTQTSKSLASCVKQVHQCVSSAEALLATWQGSCEVSDGWQPSRDSQTALTYSCLVLASAVCSLNRCGCVVSASVPCPYLLVLCQARAQRPMLYRSWPTSVMSSLLIPSSMYKDALVLLAR